MLQESMPNNSAMAATFDHEDQISRVLNQTKIAKPVRDFEEECKEVDISKDIYKLNEAKVKDLEISIDNTNIPEVEIDNFEPLKADCRI